MQQQNMPVHYSAADYDRYTTAAVSTYDDGIIRRLLQEYRLMGRGQRCLLDIGYLHRGIEKLAEVKTYQEFMPYTDRMDYMSPYSNNVAWCLAVEKLAGIEAPERAQWLRTIGCELARISSHLLWAGTMVMDAGALSVFLWTFKYREEIYSIFDEIAGSRGAVRGPFAMLLHSPDVAGRIAHTGAYIRFETTIPAQLRELAILGLFKRL